MTVRNQFLLTVWLLVVATAWGQQSGAPVRGSSRPSAYGAVEGLVLDSRGVAQPGVPVTITREDGLLIRKVLTGRNGRFDLSRLSPGLYAVDVTLPNFLPFSKAPIAIQAGAEVVVDVNLRTLADSMEISLPSNLAQASEDWKWALRTASAVRPILRLLDEIDSRQPQGTAGQQEHPVKGTVLVSAGNDSRSFGADPGLRTTFDMEYGWSGGNALDLAGSGGFERGTPAAGIRTAWDHHSDSGADSTLSLTMRQLWLAPAYFEEGSLPDPGFGRSIQSFGGRYESDKPLSGKLNIHYGAAFDSVTMHHTHGMWSPFGGFSYSSSDRTLWTVTYSGEAPRVLPGPTSADQIAGLLTIPQVSSDITNPVRHTALESGQHLEVGWDRKVSGRFRLQAAAFYDSLNDVALSIGGSNETLPAHLLRDPFSNSRFLDGGNFSSPGARATLETLLSANETVSVSYRYAGGLRVVSQTLSADDSQTLQDMIRKQEASSVAISVRSVLPRSRTELITSYEWLPPNAVFASDPYSSGTGQSEPYLNVAFVQPLPSPGIVPGQFQAIANFNNVLAQGYVRIPGSDGAPSYFFSAARSFRGGFNYIF